MSRTLQYLYRRLRHPQGGDGRLRCGVVLFLILSVPVGGVVASLESAFFVFAASPQPDTERLLQSVDEVLAKVERIRGIPSRRSIARGVKSREEIRRYVTERFQEEYPAERVRTEEQLLKRLGLIPDDMDLFNFQLELLTEQVAGYYDPVTDTFYLADWLPEAMQLPVIAHELTHALQDQEIELSDLLQPDWENDDRTLARAAVFEGEGLITMLVFVMEPMGIGVDDLPDIAALQSAQLPLMEAQFPVLAAAPAFLKASLMFPYVYGSSFMQAYLREHPWTSVGELYRNPPESTEQILHPEKYLGHRDDPTSMGNPIPPPDGPWRCELSTTIGEFTLREMLRRFLETSVAAAATAGWDGDVIALWSQPGGRWAFSLQSVWDEEGDAREFAEAMHRWMEAKHGVSGTETEPGNEFRGRTESVSWKISRSGDRVDVHEWDRPEQ